MSDYETRKGKVRKLSSKTSEFISDWETGISEIPEYYEDAIEYFKDIHQDNYIIIGEDIYEIVKDELLKNDDIFEAIENSDNEIEYILRYYNGGCGFSEALEIALEKIKG